MFKELIAFIQALYPNEKVIPLHSPIFKGNEKKYILDAIDSTFVSSIGAYVEHLEKKISVITGSKYAVAVVNGTSALHIALLMAGVKSDNEVITQPLTFVATANAVSYCGAKPIFLDVDMETLGLSPEALERFLEKRTFIQNKECYNKNTRKKIAACVPVHVFGHPCRIESIISICDKYRIPVVEDATESLGSTFHSKHTGTYGKLGVFSFNGNKIVSCGGGGIIVTDDKALGEYAKHITTTAKIPHPYNYVHDQIGYNYRLPNLNAALAYAQLEQLNHFVEQKRMISSKYASFFNDQADILFFTEPRGARSNYWLNTVILENRKTRDSLLESTNQENVMTRPIWRLLNKLAMYRNCQTDELKNAQWLEDRIVNLPSSVPDL